MTGCQSFTTASSATRLRVVDLSQDTGAIDVYEGTHALAYNLAYGAVTSYVALPPGTYTTTVVPAGLRQALSSHLEPLLAGGQYTLLVNGPLTGLQQTLLTDQLPASGPSIRFVHQAERTGAVDVYLVPAGHGTTSAVPVVTNLAPGANTGYVLIPAGMATVMILPAGTHPASGFSVLHTGRRIAYLHGSARTLILLDASPTLAHSLDVIETIDADTVN